MRTLLILTRQPALAAAIQAVLDPAQYQVVTKEDAWEAESLLSRGAIDATVLDLELTDVRAIRVIEEVKRAAPNCPLIVYAGAKQWEWEEDAYMLGVSHVLTKPVRAKLLNTLLERTLHRPEEKAPSPETAAAAPARAVQNGNDPVRALEALRHFSGVLTHSLNSEALLKQFLLLIREIVGVNRAVIFLRKPAGLLSESAHSQDDRWLRSACAIGLEQSFLEHFALSLGAGIGASLRRQGRILKASSPEAQTNREIQKEFQLLGAQVAIPILDRETLIGVAVFDERLTGEPYANEELALIFHMLEEVGLAIRNSWLHDQLVSNHNMVADILGTLGSGCVVVGSNLSILHANAAAKRHFLEDRAGKAQLEFADLPQELGSKVFTVMKSGLSIPPFKYQFAGRPDVHYQITVSPFATQRSPVPNAALLIIEDVTQNERARKLEIETSSLRLITAMAEHLAHEIGNTVVPISTHQQLLKDKKDDPEFMESLSEALSTGVKRISRLANQMMFLARDHTDFADKIRVSDLLSEAFRDAYVYQVGNAPKSPIQKEGEPFTIAGDHKALRHAFTEVILNAIQANPSNPKIAVKVQEEPGGGDRQLKVEVRDSGTGFTPEAARRAQEPFYSTRNVGLGIGLTVTQKIIEDHHGKLEIAPSEKGQPGVVRISLPLISQD
jgi:signal transduction histidine kinase/DNA-binding NarL/FixJ family response regulator